jgi:signal transduction histidine kinase
MCSYNESWSVERSDFLAAAKARAAFRACLGRIGAPGADIDGAEIIFGELLTNALRYSGSAATAELNCRNARFVLEVRDAGCGFDPEEVASGVRLGDADGGRGLSIARQLSGALEVTASKAGCRVVAALPVVCRPQ